MIKRAVLICFFVVLLAVNVQAANYYFNLASGNDTTGDGSAGNPWKTIDKCTTTRSAGDECRGAKTAITTLAGTLTFTNGSTSVGTSADLTAVVAAGDFVSKNSGLEGWHRVASLNSTVITLSFQYWGLTGSGSAVTGYKVTPVAASEELDLNSSGTSTSPILVSGGWDLTGPTQDGITAVSYTATNLIDTNAKSFVKISKFILYNSSATGINISSTSTGIEIEDVFIIGCTTAGVAIDGDQAKLTNVVHAGGTGVGIDILGFYNLLTNVYSFSAGTGSGDNGIKIGRSVICKNCRSYNSYSHNFSFATGGSGSFLTDCISDTSRAGSDTVFTDAGDIIFFNFTTNGGTAYVATAGTDTWGTISFIESTLTAGSSGTFQISTTYTKNMLIPVVVHKPVGADSILYFTYGTIEHDSSADCNSGKCLKFLSAGATISTGVGHKVGSVKIPSTASALTLNAYIKDDASFDGYVAFLVIRNGKFISKTMKDPTTSWAKNSVVVATDDLVEGEYLDLYVLVNGTAGSLFVDDFSAEQ
jgi:hypothetical protein